MYDVLCVGGPLDGQWRAVEDRTFEVAEPPKIAVDEPFTKYCYDVESIALFGFTLHVALCHDRFEGWREREKAVMRAVLQRDVANRLEAL